MGGWGGGGGSLPSTYQRGERFKFNYLEMPLPSAIDWKSFLINQKREGNIVPMMMTKPLVGSLLYLDKVIQLKAIYSMYTQRAVKQGVKKPVYIICRIDGNFRLNK